MQSRRSHHSSRIYLSRMFSNLLRTKLVQMDNMYQYVTILLSVLLVTTEGQNITTVGPGGGLPVTRDVLPKPFGLPIDSDASGLTTTATTTATESSEEELCPPNRFVKERSRSFTNCVCELDRQDPNTEQQPCVLRLSSVLGVYSGMVIPAIMPRLSATDTAFLHLWIPQGLLCNPFIGIGGLSLACYRELGGSPMTRDCRFSRAHYFCELLVCIDSILGVPSLPQHLVECIRRIPVPATVPPTLRPPTPSPFPSPVFPPVFTTTSSPTTTTTPLIDDHAGHNHGPDGIHTDEEHLKFDLIKIICGAVGGVLGGIIITVIIVACCSCKRKRQTQPPKEPRPKLPPRRQESSIYAEVEDMGSGSGCFKASNRAPDVIGALADDKSYKGLNNQNHFKGSAKGFLGRPLSVESNHYSTITEDSKRNSKSSLYNKLRDGSTSVVCDHIYNRAQYHVHEGEEYDRIGKKLNSRDNPRTIMRKEACPSPTKKRVYFTLEPLDNLDPH